MPAAPSQIQQPFERLCRAAAPVQRAIERHGRRYVRWVFARLRRHRPIVSTRRLAVVTLAADVREILANHEAFTVELYAAKMTDITGPFILGLDGTALYRHDHAALRAAIRSDDVPAIGQTMLATARECVANASGGELDVIADLADPAIDRVIASYFGTPGPETAAQLRWARSVFQQIFLNGCNDAAVRDRALADGAQMRQHIDALVASRKRELASGADVPDDVLTRLLRMQPEPGGLQDIAIRHNFIGLIVGWIPTVSKAFALVVDELLDRPEQLETAQRAARDGDQELVAAHVFEALRFRTHNSAVLRRCAVDHTVAAGTGHETTIRAGATVVVATESAMFDETAVNDPRRFRLDRPWTDYFHFGHGLHTCFGQEINRVQLPALTTALLEGARIARASAGGSMSWRGPYPSGLRVRL
jgi:cytochrome P450